MEERLPWQVAFFQHALRATRPTTPAVEYTFQVSIEEDPTQCDYDVMGMRFAMLRTTLIICYIFKLMSDFSQNPCTKIF